MYTLSLSSDNRTFKSFFKEGRRRVYDNITNAINGAKQLLRNTKNNIVTIHILNKDTGIIAAIIKLTSTGFSVEELDKGIKQTVDTAPTIDIEVTKKENSSSKSAKEKVSLSSLVEKESRIQMLKDEHEKWKQKKKNEVIEVGNTLNNLSDKKNFDSLFPDLMGDLLQKAIEDKDINRLFKLEVSLSQKGYSWYPDQSGNITVEKTDKVVDLLNKKEI